MLAKLLATQLRQPSGVLAELAGLGMNRLNQQMTAFAVEKLEVQPRHAVLDIGFGGGLSLELLAQAASEGMVVGLELSEAMVCLARRRQSRRIAAGKLELAVGSVEQIPYPDEYFDRACTVNTVYFWPDPAAGLREIFRVLKPGGLLALCFRPRQEMESLAFTQYGFQLYAPEEVARLLEDSQYATVQLAEARDEHLGYVCALIRKGTEG